ncbi:MAG: chromate transporter [Christensenellales bacterium]
MILLCLNLFFTFFKIGLAGFGGGYAMLSMIFTESQQFGITLAQFADLNALDMIVPGPIAINAATYVGYLSGGFFGALAATIGVALPSLILVTLVMHFIKRYRENRLMNGFLSGVKPAAVGLIAAAAMTIASGVLLLPGANLSALFVDPLGTVSLALAGVFIVVAVCNIKFRINPILLTLAAGIVGAVFLW